MRILTAAEMKLAEKAAVDAGTTYEQLMENAGRGAADEILNDLPKNASVLCLCGKGNNAGDALVVARILLENGHMPSLLFLRGMSLSELAQLNLDRLPDGLICSAIADKYDAVIDGVFGTGFHGELSESVRGIFRTINRMETVRFALDLPSGLNCDTGEFDPDTFSADKTYTFGAYKPAFADNRTKPVTGEVFLIDIGL